LHYGESIFVASWIFSGLKLVLLGFWLL
jgi:hypothetical protein